MKNNKFVLVSDTPFGEVVANDGGTTFFLEDVSDGFNDAEDVLVFDTEEAALVELNSYDFPEQWEIREIAL